MKLNRIQMVERYHEFPTLLIDISNQNALVRRMIEAYVHGQIATKEEVYCQLIIELAKTRDELIQRQVDEAHLRISLAEWIPNHTATSWQFSH